MPRFDQSILVCVFALICGCLASESVVAQTVDTSADNLMVVLRESTGGNEPDETLKPLGKIRTERLSDGRQIDLEIAAFHFLGDMDIRFVFDAPGFMKVAKPEDLARLHLSPEQALQLAVANIKRVYGNPIAKPWTGGLMQVKGRSPDLDSSYFLDRDFWRGLLRQHPEGLVVAVPKRGGLVFTPMTEIEAVEGLRRGVAYLYASSERMRVSSALYLFRDNRWSVFQPPQAQ
jgi:hypothetical protein